MWTHERMNEPEGQPENITPSLTPLSGKCIKRTQQELNTDLT